MITENEASMIKGIRQVQAWIYERKFNSALNACTDLLIDYGKNIIFDDDIQFSESAGDKINPNNC